MFDDLYADRAVPNGAGRWIAMTQRCMAQSGAHRSASPVDVMIAATAAHYGLVVLHDDGDFRTVARHAPEVAERDVHDVVG